MQYWRTEPRIGGLWSAVRQEAANFFKSSWKDPSIKPYSSFFFACSLNGWHIVTLLLLQQTTQEMIYHPLFLSMLSRVMSCSEWCQVPALIKRCQSWPLDPRHPQNWLEHLKKLHVSFFVCLFFSNLPFPSCGQVLGRAFSHVKSFAGKKNKDTLSTIDANDLYPWVQQKKLVLLWVTWDVTASKSCLLMVPLHEVQHLFITLMCSSFFFF